MIEEIKDVVEEVCKKYGYDSEDKENNDSLKTVLLKAVTAMLKDANQEERNLFLKLINVKGLGPKMAMPMLATGSIAGIIDAIDRENILYLTKFPKIGEKLARQIILDLKGKLASKNDINLSGDFDELVSVLESLGYKNAEIKKVLPKVNASLEIEDQIKEALKLMLK